MFRIAVCDDEKIDRKVILSMIEKYVSAYNVENSIEEYDSADGLISGIAKLYPIEWTVQIINLHAFFLSLIVLHSVDSSN